MKNSPKVMPAFRLLAIVLVAAAALRVAWMSDDALITLRTALNITHNWGPGFNATEAVQAYTHPLWFLLWVWVGSWTNQWILGVLALGVLLTAVAVALLVNQARTPSRLIVVTGLLLLSNAFMDYTSSGLENPLSYALVGVLVTLTLKSSIQDEVRVPQAILIGVTAAGVLLTRLDLLVLVVVPLTVVAWDNRKKLHVVAAGLVAFLGPLLVWLTWTFLTYSAFLPNTYAAKTNAEIPRTELVVQGIRYLWVSFENDPVTLIGLATGVILSLSWGPRHIRTWGSGVLAYVTYIVWIGGDFMAGRFLAVPFFVAVFLLAMVTPSGRVLSKVDDSNWRSGGSIPVALAVIALLILVPYVSEVRTTSLTNPTSPRWAADQNLNAGVIDARGMSVEDGDGLKEYVDNLSLAFVDPDIVPIGDGTGLGRSLRNLDKSAANWPTNDGTFTNPSEVGVFCGYLGNIGIATGPITHLIDSCALTDRFLAEMAFVPSEPFAWKAGHFDRSIPEGYVEAVTVNDPKQLVDPREGYRLQQLWEEIR